ncbi:O-antigen ligase family protein [Actomonas aquatica]|uniref:O-antigen ligase family protein n=1 Tax=Actomonas aquatica TaxID=2866162 RepID=A0ABZ1C863_9BACT|nr:O-antigen ligase family protein [Opitutus sp. WL0086]WRQ86739.1 O-antigen ligase family protein [Opitutus sp. WL0086]
MLHHLAPVWRDRLFFGGGLLVAVVSGVYVAQGVVLIPALVLAASLAVILSLVRTTALQGFVLMGLLAGYLIGNRGFAQFSLIPGLPALPAEMGLVVLAALQVIERAHSGPEARRVGALDVIVLLWIVIGSVRFLFDFRSHGFFALRDFATVYYAAFFFLTQTVLRRRPDFEARLLATLRIAAVVMMITHRLWQFYPGFFFNVLQIGGVPLIFYKADLLGVFLAVGTLLQFVRWEERGGWWRWPLMAVMTFEIIETDNRAAMLALACGGCWLVFGGRWRLAMVVLVTGVVGIFGTLWVAQQTNTPWQQTPLLGLYEKARSVIDPSGQGAYRGDDTANKGDNNRYRLVWWQTVARETVEENPVTGLGFGYDLARNFMQRYYGDNSGDYSVRSPHSIVMTVFARMGVVGLLPFLFLLGLMARHTWRALSSTDHAGLGLWIGAWGIMVSAFFGVVLEGPMGAVTFWILLGAAYGRSPLPAPVSTPGGIELDGGIDAGRPTAEQPRP